jgi:hypothetical protein
LTLAGLLRKWDVDAAALHAKARSYYLTCEFPDKWQFYNYPTHGSLKSGQENEIAISSSYD